MLTAVSFKRVYDTSSDHFARDVFTPFLKESLVYKRGVGYFTSGWLKANLPGLIPFIERGGTIKLLTSPHLAERDIDALKRGQLALSNTELYERLKNEMSLLSTGSTEQRAILSLLSWLVCDGVLELKLVIPKQIGADYHDKLAIFSDEHHNQVVLHGSYNDSLKGLINGEGISAFRSWFPIEKDYAYLHSTRFERLYRNDVSSFDVIPLPEAIEDELFQITKSTNRPYAAPPIPNHKKKGRRVMPTNPLTFPPGIDLHLYQRESIDNWNEHKKKGFVALATGMGKTYTALAASVEEFEEHPRLFTLISVPFDHLVEQWGDDAKKFGHRPIYCKGSKQSWFFQAKNAIQNYNNGFSSHVTLIVTHKTASSSHFFDLIESIREKDSIFFIADEAHYLGASYLSRALNPSISKRMGLSATPDRWRDSEGTNTLFSYFGEKVIDYGMDYAISNKFLTPYDYFPHIVHLTDDEYTEYKNLSVRIARAMSGSSPDEQHSRKLLLQRARLVDRSLAKVEKFTEVFERDVEHDGVDSFKHAIVYCPEGVHREIVREVAKTGVRTQEFVSETKNRKDVLRLFASGDAQVLCAMKCLDEGVNVPETNKAYFIASTTNPRQFIQRRGRVLRKSEETGKTHATIHDFIVFPPLDEVGSDSGTSLIKKEMARVMEFILYARNDVIAKDMIRSHLSHFGLDHLLYLSPEDINLSLYGGEVIDE